MRTGIALAGAAALIASVTLALAGCAGSGTTVPGFQGANPAVATPVPSVSATASASGSPIATASATPTPTATPAAGDLDCGNAPITLTTATLAYTLTGTCPSVTVAGDGITVSGPAVAALTINGARNTVNLGDVGPIAVNGSDNVIGAQSIASFTVSGDRDSLTSAGTIGGGTFAGNDNQVHLPGAVPAVTDNGQRNTVGP